MLSQQSLPLYCQAFMLRDGLGLDDWTLLNITPEARGQSIQPDPSFRKMQICVESILLCHHLSFQSGRLRYDTIAALLGITLYIVMNLNGFLSLLCICSAVSSPKFWSCPLLFYILNVKIHDIINQIVQTVPWFYSQQVCPFSRPDKVRCRLHLSSC